MCGIVGFTGKGNQSLLEKMNDRLAHRGPDGEGFFRNNQINLGMRRLAIIDISGGNQPIFSEDKNVVVVYNGEIYNFLDLRKELESKHKFQTNSDTEVIVHGYEEWGIKVFEKLNGMFAIVLWDERENKLVLARDRMGEKPLYYTKQGGQLIFGSEIKALLKYPGIKKQLSAQGLNFYLTYEYVPNPLTIFENIYALAPGHLLVWQNHDYQIQEYWKINFHRVQIMRSEGESIIEFDKLLDEAVKIRLVSDVPLGIFLSGGIDSGSIAYYAQKNSIQKIKTFSIGFTDKSFDESGYATQVAEHLGTEHYEKMFTSKDILDLLPEIALLQDEPLGDASLFPTHLLSRFARGQVTVALSGDGSDELLYGYPTFQMRKFAQYYFKLPQFFRKQVLSKIITNLPTSFNNITLDYALKKLDASTSYPDWQRDLVWIGSFMDRDKTLLLTKDALKKINVHETFDPLKKYFAEVQGASFLDQSSYLFLKTYLVDDILQKTDRASMYASLESRAPFLDYKLVDLLTSLPSSLKMHGFQTKYILKKLMSGKLPDHIVSRKKKGFGLPIAKWLTGELRDLVREHILYEKFIRGQGFFEYDYLKLLWQEHETGRADHRKKLWTLLMFQLWYKHWLS